jgi:hypothetical protein
LDKIFFEGPSNLSDVSREDRHENEETLSRSNIGRSKQPSTFSKDEYDETTPKDKKMNSSMALHDNKSKNIIENESDTLRLIEG